MNDFADQIKALGLKTDRPKVSVSKKSGSGTGVKPTINTAMLLPRLPSFGTVARVEEDRGFGFISSDSREDIFFHFRGYPGRLPDGQTLPRVGSPVIFIAGSDPRRPDQPKKGAFQWAPADSGSSLGGAPTNQASLNALRRRLLNELPRGALWELLEASWYAKAWKGGAEAPSDLDDEVLEQVVVERLSGLSPGDLEADQIRSRLMTSRYRFAARLTPGSGACDVARLLNVFNLQQLAVLGQPEAAWMRLRGLTAEMRTRLLEWHLISRPLTEQNDDWGSWFPGSDASEAALATRFLTYGIRPDAFTREWLDRIARNGLLTEAQAEKWFFTQVRGKPPGSSGRSRRRPGSRRLPA